MIAACLPPKEISTPTQRSRGLPTGTGEMKNGGAPTDTAGDTERRVASAATDRGVATKFGLGDGFTGTQIHHIYPKFNISSDFGHFIAKMLENAKL